MSKTKLNWRVIFKERLTNRKTGDVTYVQIADEKVADAATLYTALPIDYTKASDDIKAQVKTTLLKLAEAHVDKAGRFRYLQAESIFISAKGVGVNLLESPMVIVGTDEVELPTV